MAFIGHKGWSYEGIVLAGDEFKYRYNASDTQYLRFELRDVTLAEWKAEYQSDEPVFIEADRDGKYGSWDRTTGNYWEEDNENGWYQDKGEYDIDQAIYDQAEYQVEAWEQQQAYEAQLAELDRLEKKNLATQKELLEMEERRQKLIELSKAGVRASKFGTGSGGSPVSTLLQEIATNKGNLLS